MKTLLIVMFSFLFGAILTGIVAFKLIMSLGYEAVIGKLSDNVIFYRQIEQGKPELTQATIESSLEGFISLAQDGESSIWISPSANDKLALARAKELQSQLRENGSK